MITENVCVWLSGLWCPGSECWGCWLEIFLLTYLLTYLHGSAVHITTKLSAFGKQW